MAKPYKTHLNSDSVKTLCGLSIKQKTNLPLGNPWNINCKNCLSLYYEQNELQIKNTRPKPYA